MAPDKKSGEGPRIVFQGIGSEDQELSAQKTSTSGVVDWFGNGNDPSGEYDVYHRGQRSHGSPIPDEDTGDAVEGDEEPEEASGGT